MGSYRGPIVKICRREGVNLVESPKVQRYMERHPYPPGQHGQRRRRKISDYGVRLRGPGDLLPRLLADYPPSARRMLIDNGWFAALGRENVELGTEPVDHVAPDGLVTESVVMRSATGTVRWVKGRHSRKDQR